MAPPAGRLEGDPLLNYGSVFGLATSFATTTTITGVTTTTDGTQTSVLPLSGLSVVRGTMLGMSLDKYTSSTTNPLDGSRNGGVTPTTTMVCLGSRYWSYSQGTIVTEKYT